MPCGAPLLCTAASCCLLLGSLLADRPTAPAAPRFLIARRYQKLQGCLKEEKRAAKLLRAQLADERAAASGAATLHCRTAVASSALHHRRLTAAPPLPVLCRDGPGAPQPAADSGPRSVGQQPRCDASMAAVSGPACLLPLLPAAAHQHSSLLNPAASGTCPLLAPAGDSDYRLPALLLCDLERGSGGVWVVEAGPDYLCLGADNRLYQVRCAVHDVPAVPAVHAALGWARGGRRPTRLVLLCSASVCRSARATSQPSPRARTPLPTTRRRARLCCAMPAPCAPGVSLSDGLG